MTIATQVMRPERTVAARPGYQLSDRVLGLALASIVPAVFWTSVVAVVGNAVGQPPGMLTLALVALSITAFLAIVVASVISRS
jgi:hypothetical protein